MYIVAAHGTFLWNHCRVSPGGVLPDRYVKSLKRQAEDIENLLEKMGLQFKEMQEEYDVELEQIEDAFLKERDELITANKVPDEGLALICESCHLNN